MDKNIATQLVHLYDLQKVDSRLDDIVKLRGTLPEEVVALEEEIEKLLVAIHKHEQLLTTLQEDIFAKKAFIKLTETKIQQCDVRKMEVRNDREYDAVIKEMELHQLDIQLSEKFLRTAYEKTDQSHRALETLNDRLKVGEADLSLKKKELVSILQASEQEENTLHQKRSAIVHLLYESLYRTYERIRGSVQNKLAVVSIQKGACGGCCIVIPPQQKLEVHEQSKIVCCEHCGRMLVALLPSTASSL